MIQGKTYRVTAREPDQNKSTRRERERAQHGNHGRRWRGREVQRSEDGYKRFVIDIEKKPLSTKQIFLFRKKCMYLHAAYIIALEKFGYDKHTWVKTCCKEAVEMLAYLGLNLTLYPKRVSEWN
jgi:hypothetical protein